MIKRLLKLWRIEPMDGAYYATFYRVPGYFVGVPPDGCLMAGRNRLFDLLILILPHLHNILVAPFYDYGFPVRVGPRVDGSDAERWVQANRPLKD